MAWALSTELANSDLLIAAATAVATLAWVVSPVSEMAMSPWLMIPLLSNSKIVPPPPPTVNLAPSAGIPLTVIVRSLPNRVLSKALGLAEIAGLALLMIRLFVTAGREVSR